MAVTLIRSTRLCLGSPCACAIRASQSDLDLRMVIMDEAEGQLARMSDEWSAILVGSGDDRAVLAGWEQSMDSMRLETACLRDQGLWRAAPYADARAWPSAP